MRSRTYLDVVCAARVVSTLLLLLHVPLRGTVTTCQPFSSIFCRPVPSATPCARPQYTAQARKLAGTPRRDRAADQAGAASVPLSRACRGLVKEEETLLGIAAAAAEAGAKGNTQFALNSPGTALTAWAQHLWLHHLPQLCVGCWCECIGCVAPVVNNSLASMVCKEKAGYLLEPMLACVP